MNVKSSVKSLVPLSAKQKLRVIALVLLAGILSGCVTNDQTVSPIAECSRLLSPDLKTKIQSVNITTFSAALRDHISEAIQWSKTNSDNDDLSIGYDGFNLTGSAKSQLLESLQKKFEATKDYTLSYQEFSYLTISTINDQIAKDFVECIKGSSGVSVVPLAVDDSHIQFTVKWVPPQSHPNARAPRVTSIVVSDGAAIKDSPLRINQTLSSGGTVLYMSCTPKKPALLQVNTKSGSASAIMVWREPAVWSPYNEAAFKKAHDDWQGRVDERNNNPVWIDYLNSGIAGPKSYSWSLQPNDRLLALHGRGGTGVDNFYFSVMTSTGVPSNTPSLNDHNGTGPYQDYELSGDEHITGYKVRHGALTDAIIFRTSTGRELALGGNGGGVLLPSSGEFAGTGNDYELFSLTAKAGRTVDDLRGGFRKNYTVDLLREPKLEDFPNQSPRSIGRWVELL